MAGLAAGVISEAQVNSQPQPPSKMSAMLSDPGTWALIWTAVAFFYLIAIYLGMIVIRRKGA